MSRREDEHWPIDRAEHQVILPAPPEDTWLHGTKTEPFDTPLPGTCFTRDAGIAEHFAKYGSYQAPFSQEGESRVLEASIAIPEGAPFWPVSPLFGQYLDMVDKLRPTTMVEAQETGDYRRGARAEYHEAAASMTEELGYRAYWADLYGGRNDACLLVLDPETVTITRQQRQP